MINIIIRIDENVNQLWSIIIEDIIFLNAKLIIHSVNLIDDRMETCKGAFLVKMKIGQHGMMMIISDE